MAFLLVRCLISHDSDIIPKFNSVTLPADREKFGMKNINNSETIEFQNIFNFCLIFLTQLYTIRIVREKFPILLLFDPLKHVCLKLHNF